MNKLFGIDHFEKEQEDWERLSLSLPPNIYEIIKILTKHLKRSLYFNGGQANIGSVTRELVKLGLIFTIYEIENGDHPTEGELDRMRDESFLVLYNNMWINGIVSEELEERFLSRCEELMRAKQQDAKEKH